MDPATEANGTAPMPAFAELPVAATPAPAVLSREDALEHMLAIERRARMAAQQEILALKFTALQREMAAFDATDAERGVALSLRYALDRGDSITPTGEIVRSEQGR